MKLHEFFKKQEKLANLQIELFIILENLKRGRAKHRKWLANEI